MTVGLRDLTCNTPTRIRNAAATLIETRVVAHERSSPRALVTMDVIVQSRVLFDAILLSISRHREQYSMLDISSKRCRELPIPRRASWLGK